MNNELILSAAFFATGKDLRSRSSNGFQKHKKTQE